MRLIASLTLLTASGCYAAHALDAGGEAGPAPLVDVDPDPGVVAVELVAGPSDAELLPGLPAQVWAYRDGAVPGSRGTVPGPLLEAREGDLVIVRFRNELPVETTIHWHGIRLDAMYDGTPASQVPVPPGGTYEYRFVARDPGFYWYHRHVVVAPSGPASHSA